MYSLPESNGLVGARSRPALTPVSLAEAYRMITKCRDYRTRYGVFLPNKSRGLDTVILHSIYLKDADWKRYLVRDLAFEAVEKLLPHLCVGLYSNQFRKFSLAELQSDVCFAYFYRAYWEAKRDFDALDYLGWFATATENDRTARVQYLPAPSRQKLHGFFDRKQDKYRRPKKFTFARYNESISSGVPAFSIPDDLPAYRKHLRAQAARAKYHPRKSGSYDRTRIPLKKLRSTVSHWNGNPDFYSVEVMKLRVAV